MYMHAGVETLVPISVFAMVVLIVWIAHLAKRSAIQQRAELRRHLLDKFNSGQDLSQFLTTPQGQSFLKELDISQKAGSAKHRILRSITAGILVLGIGLGFLALLRQIVWWRAQFENRQKATEKALRPLAVANLAAVTILLLLASAAWLRSLQFLSSGWLVKGSPALQPALISVTALVAVSLILFLLRAFTPVFTEE
jgi:hypothetical protein